MPDISFDAVTDAKALADRWRALEAQAEGGFFRGWTYLGTLLPHFAAPHVLAVRQDGRDLALGLFDRRRRLSLHETGDPAWDRIYVEHNGLLLHPEAGACVAPALGYAVALGSITLSGIGAAHLQAAGEAGVVHVTKTDFAPALDLAALAASGVSHLDGLSANARAQIRRAIRLYGPDLTLRPAASIAEAHDYFDRMVSLHQASWTARGAPGAFANPAIRAFHNQLIAIGFPRGELALLRVSAGPHEIGYLYQLQHGGRMLCYQSGFAPEADARRKPGLVSHALAIAHAQSNGFACYDFLAGAQRYKTTLAPHGGETLYWVTLHATTSAMGRLHRLRRALRR
jgi:CelD/BcsL family acetyltransferase involved in cellulose biosynthesis